MTNSDICWPLTFATKCLALHKCLDVASICVYSKAKRQWLILFVMVVLFIGKIFDIDRYVLNLKLFFVDRKKDEQTTDSCRHLLGGYVGRYLFGGRSA